MRARKRRSLFRIIVALGIAFPSFIGILAVQAQVIANESSTNKPALQVGSTLSATPTLRQAVPALLSPTSSSLPESGLPTSASLLPSALYAYIQAPSGTVSTPYVLLSAFSSLPRTVSVTIRGLVNSQEFICTGSPCAIELPSSSRLVFAAYAETGETSETVIASVSVTQVTDGYLVTIDSVNQFTSFRNACSNVWGVTDEQNVTWDDFVQFPYQIHTRKTLHYLATQLLLKGIVDASSCPSGGLSLGLNWPTACGLERASQAMIDWQNQFDDQIWLASRDIGIPPKILKTLIEIESQFWPGNSRFYLDEYGLGQTNQLGVDVLLRKDPLLFQSVCPGVLSDCARSYVSLNPQQQAMIRGAVMNQIDATCTDCPYGIDLAKAKESVSILARLFQANCQQVDYILSLAARPDPDADAATATAAIATQEKLQKIIREGDPTEATVAVATLIAGTAISSSESTSYEDLWRFTFLAYHSGLSCLQNAVNDTKKDDLPITWENLEDRIDCRGGADYVNGFMGNLLSFDLYLYQPSEASTAVVAPTIVATRTFIPTPTEFVSTATVRVQVFLDRNGNGSPDPDEWIDAMSVLLETSTNDRLTQRTQNGIAIFDMSGFTPGIEVNVSLPGLYRNERFQLPQQGEVTVTFMFEAPPVPTIIP